MAGFLDEQGLRHLVTKISTTFVPNDKIHERLGLSGTSDNPILLYELKSGDYTITKDSYVKMTPNSTPSAVTSTDITLTLQRNYYGDLYTHSYIIAGFFNVIYTDGYKITPSESLNDHKFDLTKGSDPCITTNTYLANFKLNGVNIAEGSIYAPTSSGTSGQILSSQGNGSNPKWIDFPEHFSGDYNDLSNKPTLFNGDYNSLSNKPTLFSGSYNDLTGKPDLFSGKYEDLSGKPTIPDLSTLATVAHTGNYDDLTNKPTIPSITGLATEDFVNQKIAVLTENNTDAMDSLKELADALNNDKNFAATMATELGKKANKATTLAGYGITDAKISNGTITLGSSSIKPLTSFTETDPTVPAWAKEANKPTYTWTEITDKPSFFSGSYNDLTNKPTLFSGSYNDLTNKPTIPTVNNATLTIQKNGTNVATFTANASSNVTANITVPTGAAANKGVVTSITTSDDLPTSTAVKTFVEGKGYLTSNAVTSVNGQTGAVTLTIPTGAAANKGVVTSITTSDNLPTSTAVKTFVEGKGYVTESGTVAKATTADSATQATKDASGNTITTTYATKTELNTVLGSIPNVPSWALAPSKPSYSASDVGAVPTSRTINGKALTSNITLSASDVGAVPSTTTIPTVNNATLTIQKNGTNVATFTANASSNVTANISVPTGAAANKGVATSLTTSTTDENTVPTSKAVADLVKSATSSSGGVTATRLYYNASGFAVTSQSLSSSSTLVGGMLFSSQASAYDSYLIVTNMGVFKIKTSQGSGSMYTTDYYYESYYNSAYVYGYVGGAVSGTFYVCNVWWDSDEIDDWVYDHSRLVFNGTPKSLKVFEVIGLKGM